MIHGFLEHKTSIRACLHRQSPCFPKLHASAIFIAQRFAHFANNSVTPEMGKLKPLFRSNLLSKELTITEKFSAPVRSIMRQNRHTQMPPLSPCDLWRPGRRSAAPRRAWGLSGQARERRTVRLSFRIQICAYGEPKSFDLSFVHAPNKSAISGNWPAILRADPSPGSDMKNNCSYEQIIRHAVYFAARVDCGWQCRSSGCSHRCCCERSLVERRRRNQHVISGFVQTGPSRSAVQRLDAMH